MDPFELPDFTLYPGAPYTEKEITDFELIKADHVKALLIAALPDNFESLPD
jgi:hypothetical protein